MKTAEQIIEEICPNRPWNNGSKTDAMIIKCMEQYAEQFKENPKYNYYIHIQRESRDDDYTLHEVFDKEMSETDIINFLHFNDYPYEPDYNRLTFHKVY